MTQGARGGGNAGKRGRTILVATGDGGFELARQDVAPVSRAPPHDRGSKPLEARAGPARTRANVPRAKPTEPIVQEPSRRPPPVRLSWMDTPPSPELRPAGRGRAPPPPARPARPESTSGSAWNLLSNKDWMAKVAQKDEQGKSKETSNPAAATVDPAALQAKPVAREASPVKAASAIARVYDENGNPVKTGEVNAQSTQIQETLLKNAGVNDKLNKSHAERLPEKEEDTASKDVIVEQKPVQQERAEVKDTPAKASPEEEIVAKPTELTWAKTMIVEAAEMDDEEFEELGDEELQNQESQHEEPGHRKPEYNKSIDKNDARVGNNVQDESNANDVEGVPNGDTSPLSLEYVLNAADLVQDRLGEGEILPKEPPVVVRAKEAILLDIEHEEICLELLMRCYPDMKARLHVQYAHDKINQFQLELAGIVKPPPGFFLAPQLEATKEQKSTTAAGEDNGATINGGAVDTESHEEPRATQGSDGREVNFEGVGSAKDLGETNGRPVKASSLKVETSPVQEVEIKKAQEMESRIAENRVPPPVTDKPAQATKKGGLMDSKYAPSASKAAIRNSKGRRYLAKEIMALNPKPAALDSPRVTIDPNRFPPRPVQVYEIIRVQANKAAQIEAEKSEAALKEAALKKAETAAQEAKKKTRKSAKAAAAEQRQAQAPPLRNPFGVSRNAAGKAEKSEPMSRPVSPKSPPSRKTATVKVANSHGPATLTKDEAPAEQKPASISHPLSSKTTGSSKSTRDAAPISPQRQIASAIRRASDLALGSESISRPATATPSLPKPTDDQTSAVPQPTNQSAIAIPSYLPQLIPDIVEELAPVGEPGNKWFPGARTVSGSTVSAVTTDTRIKRHSEILQEEMSGFSDALSNVPSTPAATGPDKTVIANGANGADGLNEVEQSYSAKKIELALASQAKARRNAIPIIKPPAGYKENRSKPSGLESSIYSQDDDERRRSQEMDKPIGYLFKKYNQRRSQAQGHELPKWFENEARKMSHPPTPTDQSKENGRPVVVDEASDVSRGRKRTKNPFIPLPNKS